MPHPLRAPGVSRLRGAPKRSRACHKRAAFSAVGRTQRSMSPVALGIPWPATAYAPTTRYSTPSSANAFNISAKSRFIAWLSTEGPGGHRERPDHFNSFGRRHRCVRVWLQVAKSPDPLGRRRGAFAGDRYRALLGDVVVYTCAGKHAVKYTPRLPMKAPHGSEGAAGCWASACGHGQWDGLPPAAPRLSPWAFMVDGARIAGKGSHRKVVHEED